MTDKGRTSLIMLTTVVPTFELHFLGEIILAGVTLGQVAIPLRLRHLDIFRGLLVQLHLHGPHKPAGGGREGVGV